MAGPGHGAPPRRYLTIIDARSAAVLQAPQNGADEATLADLAAAARSAVTVAVKLHSRRPAAARGRALADLATRHALLPTDWARIPSPTPGLSRALPAVLARSPAEAAQLVAHLPAEARGRLRALALCLARLQRRLRLELPEPIEHRILASAPVEDEEREHASQGSSGEGAAVAPGRVPLRLVRVVRTEGGWVVL